MTGDLLAILFGPFSVSAQVTPSDPVSLYAPLGVAGLICVVLTWVWLRAEKRADAAEVRERQLSEKMLERFVPILVDATRVLSETQRGMEAQVDRARLDPSRIEGALAELQAVVGDLRGTRKK